MKKDWIEVELGEVADIISGKNQKEVENPNGEYPIYGSGGVFGFADQYLCPPGTTVIGRKGTINSPIFVNEKFWNVDTAFGIHPCEFVLPKLLFYFCKGFNFKNLDKSTTIPSLAKRDLLQINFPLIPLPEQRAIVARIEELFSELDHSITNLKSAQDKLEIYRQAVLKKAFEGGFDRNVEWSYVPIHKLCEVVRGGSPRPAGDPKFYDGDIPFLKVADLTRSKGPYLNTFTYSIKEAGLKKTRLVKPNTLLLSNSGATLGVPRICTFETTFNDGIAAFLGLDKEELLYHFYFWTSKTQELRNIDQGAAQPNLNTGLIGSIEIPVGPLVEMKKVVQEIESRLSVADKLAETIQTNLLKSESLRQSILKQALEGKLLTEAEMEACRKEADWEPAEKLLERIKGEKNKSKKS